MKNSISRIAVSTDDIPISSFAQDKNLAILIPDNHRHSFPLAGEIQQVKNFELPVQKASHVNPCNGSRRIKSNKESNQIISSTNLSIDP